MAYIYTFILMIWITDSQRTDPEYLNDTNNARYCGLQGVIPSHPLLFVKGENRQKYFFLGLFQGKVPS